MSGPSFGVEEEFLLVDGHTGRPVSCNRAVAGLAAARGVELQLELTACQVETATAKSESSDQVRQEISHLRTVAGEAAREAGAVLLAVGAPPVGHRNATITGTERYRRIAEHFGALAADQCVCGCHVHVEVPNRDAAVQVSNWLRAWLPLLLALTANSAVHAGVDTGYASWRSVLWGRWPSAGPPPHFDSVAHYDDIVTMLTDSGAILDEGMLYWDVRPSSKFPTVEIRVADVAATSAQAVLLATLCRAAVMTALGCYERGRSAPRIDEHLLRAAYWRAARDGLDGLLLNPFSDWAAAPAARVLGDFVTMLRPALAELGEEQIDADVGDLLVQRNGAGRQRRAIRGSGGLAGVVADAAAATLS